MPFDRLTQTFPSGLRFSFRRSQSAVAYCALSVRTGTRDEDPGLGGLAHFTEHLLFKGTARRTAASINNRLERLGGELNAYTTKEETVLHATVLKEDLAKAVDLLFELAFASVFPEKELEKERTVILDEINSCRDVPAEQIFDDFEERMFAGTPLSVPVLGRAVSLKRIDRNAVVSYVARRFIPERMSFTVVADLPSSQVCRIVGTAADAWCPSGSDGSAAALYPETGPSVDPFSLRPFRETVRRRGFQAHCVLGVPAYSAYDPRRIPLILLVNLLGGPAANSRLNTVLRERNALVYGVDAAYNAYRDCGCLTVYFGCDREHFGRCLELTLRELNRLADEPLSRSALQAARKQWLGQYAVSSDNGESQVLAMGKSLLMYGHVLEPGQVRELMERVTSADLQSVAREMFAPHRLSCLAYGVPDTGEIARMLETLSGPAGGSVN